MKKLWILLLIFAVILGGAVFFRDDIIKFYLRISLELPKIKSDINNLSIKEIIQVKEESVSLPPPLRATKEEPQAFLTRAGVIQWTNSQRAQQGFPPLKENAELDASALVKAKDMLSKQYFAHKSPSGVGVADLSREAGYAFIEIGENLALGNFENDQVLVQAWMDSPGHRANILNSKYQDIGVAVIKGIYEGRSTWLAVQHFGFPLSACAQPSQSLKAEIILNQSRISQIQESLLALKNEIGNIWPRNQSDYNQKIEEYNNLVSQFNNLANETESLINQYNNQVQAFNQCVGKI